MIELPSEIFSCAQVRELDRLAIDVYGIPSYTLMTRAGEAALESIRARWPTARALTIVCGAGNNAGDGYVVARLARASGYRVDVIGLVPGAALGGDAKRAFDEFSAAGGTVTAYGQHRALDGHVLVDALLGTGLSRALSAQYVDAVAELNRTPSPTLSLDIPSGLDADTGCPLGTAVEADATITFVGLKLGLFVGQSADYRGDLEFAGLGVPQAAYARLQPPAKRLERACIRRALPARRRTSHKGDHGRVLLIGGAPGMAGAIRLAAEAALRAGAGLARVATHAESAAAIMAGRPEIMSSAVAGPAELEPLLAAADAIVLGPGLGTSAWAGELWRCAIDAARPLVIDADGLNLLAAHEHVRDDWLLTPHPGEAARLLGRDTAAVQRDRVAALTALQERYRGVVVLKGAGTLIAGPGSGPIGVCDRGNPGMATAGMGDVLAGLLGALLAQGLNAREAAEVGVLVHALAGDAATVAGQRGLLAGDLMPHIRRLVNTG